MKVKREGNRGFLESGVKKKGEGNGIRIFCEMERGEVALVGLGDERG